MPGPATSPSLREGLRTRLGLGDATEARATLYASHVLLVGALALSNMLLALSLLSAPWRRRLDRADWVVASPLLIPFGLYVLFLLVSIAVSYEPVTSLRALTEVFSLTTTVLAVWLVRGERWVRRVVDGMIAVGALFALWGLAQYLMGYGDLDRRIRGPFSHYMTFAGVLLMIDLLLLAAMVCGRGVRSPWRWVALGAINLALVGSLTRSAWLGLLVAVTVLVLVRAPRLLLLYPPVALAAVLLAPAPVLQRAQSIAELEDPSNYDRLCMAEAGLHMLAERPLFGIGPELVKPRYAIYRHPTAPRYSVPHLHNNLLQLGAERGLATVAAYTWTMLSGLLVAWRSYRQEGGRLGPRADLHLGTFVALLAFNLAGLFENNWGDTEVQRVALFVLALPFCLALGREVTVGAPVAGTVAVGRGEATPGVGVGVVPA